MSSVAFERCGAAAMPLISSGPSTPTSTVARSVASALGATDGSTDSPSSKTVVGTSTFGTSAVDGDPVDAIVA